MIQGCKSLQLPGAIQRLGTEYIFIRYPTPFFSAASKCWGSKRASEDSSDAVFLLVENYTMTALYGLRIVWEFLKTQTSLDMSASFSSGVGPLWTTLEKKICGD